MALSRLTIDLAVSLARFESDMNRAARISNRQMDKMRRNAERFAQNTGRILGTALATGFVAATKAASDFEKSMAEVSTLLDDTSGLDATADAIKNISVQFGQAPTQQAKALYQIISAGASDAASQIEILTAANKLAVGGITDVETAADGLTSVLNAFENQGLGAQKAVDVMFSTMRLGKTTIGELSASIGNVATIAAQTGVSFEELGASIATVTVGGINTSQAVDGLRGVLSAVLKQSDQTKDAAEELGIQFDVNALKAKGLQGVLMDIANSGATEDQLSRLVGRVEGLTNILAQVREGGNKFIENLEQIATQTGVSEEAVAKMMDTTAFKSAQASAALDVLRINIGNLFLSEISGAATSFVDNFSKIEKAILIVIGAMKVLANTVVAVVKIIVGMGDVIVQSFDYIIDNILETLNLVNNVSNQVLRLNFTAAVAEVENSVGRFGQIFNEAGTDTGRAVGFIKESLAEIPAAFTDVLDELVEWENRQRRATQSTNDFSAAIGGFVDDVLGPMPAAITPAAEGTENLTDTFDELEAAAKEINDRLKENQRAQAKFVAGVKASIRENERWKQSLEDIERQFDPVGTLVDEFEQQMQDLAKAVEKGTLSQEQMQARLNFLSDALGVAAAASMVATEQIVTDADRMREATLEAVRSMTQAFLGMWGDIISGADTAFDGMIKGLENTLAQFIHSISTAKIGEELQKGINGGQVNFKNLASGVGTAFAVAIGSELGGGGQAASIGSALGGAIGSIWGPIGSAIGSLLGGLVGGLFDRKPETTIGGSGFAGANSTNTNVSTPFGNVQSIVARGGVGSFGTDSAGGEIGNAIMEFDNAMFDLIAAVSSTEQIDSIRSALASWGGTWKEGAITIENILGSRFETILGTFEADVQRFVTLAGDFENQVKRFDVALRAQAVFTSLPELFPQRTLDEFLNVIDAFAVGGVALEDAFEYVIKVLDQIAGVQTALTDFADSDLAGEFDAILAAQEQTVAGALAAVNTELMNAISNFDGTADSFSNIANIVSQVREGEIRYLTQLNQLQKGLNANLDSLRADILGLTEAPKSASELLGDATALISQIGAATSAEEIAALQQQFSAIIRGIDDADATALQDQIIGLIDTFQSSANQAIEGFRSDALANAQNTRDSINTFLDRVGDPLQMIAATNERAAAALENLAGIEPENNPTTLVPTQVSTQTFSAGGSAGDQNVIAQQQNLANELRDIQREGNDNLAFIMTQNNQALINNLIFALQRARFQVIMPPNSNSNFVNT